MKKIYALLFSIVFSTIVFGQSAETENSNRTYTNETIGWTIVVPDGWSIVSKETTERHEKKGMAALEKSVGKDIDVSGLKNLIGFQKGKFNIFQSTTEPFKVKYKGEWEKNLVLVKDLLVETYKKNNIKVETSKLSTEKIDGLEFKVYTFKLFSPNGDNFLTQMIFVSLIDGLQFGVNLSYNNEEDKMEMLTAFRNSKFTIAEPPLMDMSKFKKK